MRKLVLIFVAFSTFCFFGCENAASPQSENDTPAYYSIAFETDGGSEVLSISGVAKGSKINKPDDPAKPGYAFDGWYKDKQYKATWNLATDVVTGPTTLYAKWINTPPNNVALNSCEYNAETSCLEISYILPDDIDLDRLMVNVDGTIYQEPIKESYVSIYLPGVAKVTLVRITTADTAGLISNETQISVSASGIHR
jgi:uncharacterized repeat protein (TIGR02543 family)